MSINNWQLVTTYTYTPATTGQIFINEEIGYVNQNARRVGVSVQQDGDLENFIELAKGHTVHIVEFSQSRYLVGLGTNGQCGVSYAYFATPNRVVIKLYQVI